MGLRAIRTAFVATTAISALLAAGEARAANGAYAVDAADISEVGSCKVESWISSATNTDWFAKISDVTPEQGILSLTGPRAQEMVVDWYANHALRILCATAPIVASISAMPILVPVPVRHSSPPPRRSRAAA